MRLAASNNFLIATPRLSQDSTFDPTSWLPHKCVFVSLDSPIIYILLYTFLLQVLAQLMCSHLHEFDGDAPWWWSFKIISRNRRFEDVTFPVIYERSQRQLQHPKQIQRFNINSLPCFTIPFELVCLRGFGGIFAKRMWEGRSSKCITIGLEGELSPRWTDCKYFKSWKYCTAWLCEVTNANGPEVNKKRP